MKLNKITSAIITPIMVTLAAVTAQSASAKQKEVCPVDTLKFMQYNPETVAMYASVPSRETHQYYDDAGNLKSLNLKIGSKWQDINIENENLKSIIEMIMEKGEYITEREYVLLDRLFELIDRHGKKSTKNNNILDPNEIDRLKKHIERRGLSRKETTFLQAPEVYEKTNWSEGLDRHINYIKIAATKNKPSAIVKKELEEIGDKMGFKVAEVEIDNHWLEDYSIRCHDGIVYMPNVIDESERFAWEKDPSIAYNRTVDSIDRMTSKFFLEGGNVLNTRLKDGSPAAIIGADEIDLSILMYEYDDKEKMINYFKKRVAKELDLPEDKILYMPQLDFHIDMFYRPLQNGVIAVPDLEKGIDILESENLDGIDKEAKDQILELLKQDAERTMEVRKEAEKALQDAGYDIVRIPCFSYTSENGASTINYMNGVGGTAPDGRTFYITNRSEIDKLDEIAAEYFKKAGVDEVFFVSTLPYMFLFGGIDCMTQEM